MPGPASKASKGTRRLLDAILVSCLALRPLAVPTATLTALSTQTRTYSSQVQLSYVEPVNCTIVFNEVVVNFAPSALELSPGAQVLSFVAVSGTTYTFQLVATRSTNVSVSIPPGAVQNVAGAANSQTLAPYSFQYYAYPPSISLRLDGFSGSSTSKLNNVAYLIFNSTTDYDGVSHFGASSVALSPNLTITRFQRVDSMTFKFSFNIIANSTAEASQTSCVATSVSAAAGQTLFGCSLCPRSQRCLGNTRYPPAGVAFLEFPFQVLVATVLGLSIPATTLPFVYDTLWPQVSLSAPAYADAPFWITVSWSEAMANPAAALPIFGSGPPVDQAVLKRNLTVVNASCYKLLVSPVTTGILAISINGTQDTMDLAGNANDFFNNPQAGTGSQQVVTFSAGPPLAGSVSFQYTRLQALYEVGATSSPVGSVPSLNVSWTGFVTATHYDVWLTWGSTSTEIIANLTSSNFVFSPFTAMLGVEYTANLRAYNYWGDVVTTSKVFLHPELDVVADGTHSAVRLPDLLGPLGTDVAFDVFIPKEAFLSFNPTEVLAVRTIDRAAGDADPCSANSQTLRCTFLNVHVQAPGTQFLVFQNPIQLQFTFGRAGWTDPYFQPRLYYWEPYEEAWRVASASCPPSQFYEDWNDLFKIYTVSVCHLTQFAVFATFLPSAAAAPAAAQSRPGSFADPMLFVGIAIAVVGATIICTLCYLVRARPWLQRAPKIPFEELGIRPVTERLPSRRPRAGPPVAVAPSAEDVRELLPALPAPAELAQLEDVAPPQHALVQAV